MRDAGEATTLGRASGYALACVVAALAYAGYRTFWFLTDDAFIAFRYAQNFVMGRGLVWNPAPFVPVEGYTSFLWTFGLALWWKLTGITPPAAANVASFACGLATLWLVARMVLDCKLPMRAERFRVPMLGLVLLGTLTNRTFLTWLSSGLETALVNLLLTAWLWAALRHRPLALGSSAALLALTRPDGLLFVAATPIVLGLSALTRRERFPRYALAPLVVVPLHLGYRLYTYGEWVPNTYFAKHVAAWPESGVRYAGSFVLEYAVWWWALLFVAFLAAVPRSGWLRERANAQLPAAAAIAALLAHVAYYTLVIGGDHFEFRVYSQLVPLLFASAAFMAAYTFERASLALGSVALFVVLSWPIPWTHYLLTKDLTAREATRKMVVPVAPHVLLPFRPLAAEWDALQAWLIPRHVCARHQEHKAFWQLRAGLTPSRENGARIAWADRPVLAAQSVGIFGWRLPNVAILDRFGLNDRVVAHTPVDPHAERLMAHDRHPPEGYIECFRPNVFFMTEGMRVTKRDRPLTDGEIRACEQRFAKLVGIAP